MPPALVVEPVFSRSGGGSTRRGRFSDEPFGRRDIQFDYPGIRVEPSASREEIRDFDGTRRIGGPTSLPGIISVEGQDPFETGGVCTAARNDEEQRSALGIPFADHGREAAFGLDTPKHARRLDLCRQPAHRRTARRSGRVAFIRPHQHSRERVAAAGAAHPLERRLIARNATDRGQRLQMLGAGIGRGKEQKD